MRKRNLVKSIQKYIAISFLSMVLFIASCADVKTVSSASTSAISTLKTYDDIGYNFTYSFKQYTIPANMYAGAGTGKSVSIPDLSYTDADMATALKADEAINLLFNSLTSYFQGIGQLSDKDLVNYNFSTLADSIVANNAILAKTGVSKNQVSAASKIATVAANEIMGVYREKKLREIILEHDADVQDVVTGLNTMLNILIKNTGNDSLLLINKYVLVLANPTVEKSAKVTALTNFTSEMTDLQNKKLMLVKLIQGLQKIGDGNHALATSLKNIKLSSKEAADIIEQHAGEVYSVYTQIEQLNTKN